MKRLQNRSLLEFVTKIPRVESSEPVNNENIPDTSSEKDNNIDIPSDEVSVVETEQAQNAEDFGPILDLPDCWTMEQCKDFKKNMTD